VEIVLPPLRERLEDIADLARTLLQRLAREQGEARGEHSEPPELTREALRLLMGHTWPGNVRELENALRRALVLSDGSRITEAELELAPRRPPGRSRSRDEFQADERERIFEALRASGWNVSHVARTLAIPRNTLYRKMQKYGIAPARN
jgi:DNA-binding NtrC family response regulator